MVPININSRRFALIDSDLPSTDRKPTPSCSPEIQNSPFVFQNIGQPKQSRIDGEVWPPIFKPEFIRWQFSQSISFAIKKFFLLIYLFFSDFFLK